MCVTIKRNTESESNHMLIDIAINKKRLRIMINSNVSKSFIATRYTNYHELLIQRKNVVYRLLKTDDTKWNNEWVKKKVTIQLKICDITEQIIFDIVDLINYDVILKISWLRRTNSQIDWMKSTLNLKNQQIIRKFCILLKNENETHHQKMWKMTRRQIRLITRNNSNLLKSAWVRSLQSSINAIEKKFKEIKQFLEEYAKYKKLFQNDIETKLSNHQFWNHEIKLKDKKNQRSIRYTSYQRMNLKF